MIKRLLTLLDEHILGIIAAFLLVFIPLYPKLPLFEIIPGYIVRVRLEDLFISTAVLIYLVQAVRKKVTFWKTPLTLPILFYIAIGFFSVLSALFITRTVPLEAIHINKIFLHFGRRIEYFALFFIFFASTRSIKQVKLYFLLFIGAVVGVTIYGYGQKYLYWPAFSTMNREFAKGWMLYLSEHARVLSTFGGHYDLAAFTMMALAFLWSLFFGLKGKVQRILLALILAGSFWLIILTASRISFIAYIIALSIVVFLWMFRRGLGWGVTRWIGAVGLSIIIMLSFGDLSERFMRIFRLDERFGGIRTLLLKPAVAPPVENAVFLENSIAAVTSKSDMPPTTVKPGSGSQADSLNQPADVVEDVPEWVDTQINPDGSIQRIPKKRVYSQTALQFDLSTGIRLDALWPRAWRGFLRNPLLGSGYSTLTKERVTDFTEAESTDNGYLRALGETGALGTIAFFGIIFSLLFALFHALGGIRETWFYAVIAGTIASIFGLLVNASYIDIFEASKVALPFWAIAGIVLAGISKEKGTIEKNWQPLKITINWQQAGKSAINFVRSDFFLLFLILILALVLRLQKIHAPLADWHSWRQADTSAVTRNFDRFGINLLYPTFDDLSSVASGKPNPKGLRMVEFPIYNAVALWVKKIVPELGIEGAGRLTSALASLGSVVFLFLIMKKYHGRRIAYLTALIFSILPYNIFYSRTILPEPSLVFTSLGMIYFFDRWLEESSKLNAQSSKVKSIIFFILALILAAVSLLIKPYAGFLFLPIFYLIYLYRGWKGFLNPWILGFFVVSVIPFAWWRMWISQFPEGIPAYTWLLNGDGIRFKGAFFFWIFADRIARLILGYWGLPLLAIGLVLTPKEKPRYLFHVWFLGILLYLTTFATGNVRHDYYQIMTVPILSIFVALGVDFLLFQRSVSFKPLFSRFLGVVSLVFMVMFGWYFVRDYFNINHEEIVKAGQAVKESTNWKAKVVAPYGGDTAFLYQTERFGWPLSEGSIEDMVAKGAHYYVSVAYDDFTKSVMAHAKKPDDLHPYKIIKEDPRFVIIQLVPDKLLPKD